MTGPQDTHGCLSRDFSGRRWPSVLLSDHSHFMAFITQNLGKSAPLLLGLGILGGVYKIACFYYLLLLLPTTV